MEEPLHYNIREWFRKSLLFGLASGGGVLGWFFLSTQFFDLKTLVLNESKKVLWGSISMIMHNTSDCLLKSVLYGNQQRHTFNAHKYQIAFELIPWSCESLSGLSLGGEWDSIFPRQGLQIPVQGLPPQADVGNFKLRNFSSAFGLVETRSVGASKVSLDYPSVALNFSPNANCCFRCIPSQVQINGKVLHVLLPNYLRSSKQSKSVAKLKNQVGLWKCTACASERLSGGTKAKPLNRATSCDVELELRRPEKPNGKPLSVHAGT